jgi:rubrerythrin
MELDDDECFNDERHNDDDQEWTCDVCGGPMYSAPHWNYAKCDYCGAIPELESDI